MPGIGPHQSLHRLPTSSLRTQIDALRLKLGKELGNPILTTSAATPEGSVFHDPTLIQDYFGSRIDIVIDGGIVAGEPSSVISLIDDVPEVIRRGMGDVSMFE